MIALFVIFFVALVVIFLVATIFNIVDIKHWFTGRHRATPQQLVEMEADAEADAEDQLDMTFPAGRDNQF